MEGKVNDFTYAGVRLAGGGAKADSTNDTLQKFWDKAPVYFDQYYMRFEAPSDLIRSFGQYFSDFKIWAGRFPNPFNSTEMTWDPDICPEGVALQYTSPDVHIGSLPSMNIYTNLASLWLDENTNLANDSILWGGQIGVKTDEFGPLASKLDLSTAMYYFSNLQGQSNTGVVTPRTNTLSWDASQGMNQPPIGTWYYKFNVFDILISLDNQKIGDTVFPHGFYSEYINNICANNSNTQNQGLLLGAYIGKKKPKDPGDWKIRAEWRYIGRDSIPDFMTDSDFYGFGTFSTTAPFNPVTEGGNGLPVEGGTNTKGVKLAADYVLFKNTTLTAAYFWLNPIKSVSQTDPWNEVQLDVVTKF